MTVCVAALCDKGSAMVLVSDKMVGTGGYIEGEPEIEKLIGIHPHWTMMMSGDDISPLFELADLARAELPSDKPAHLHEVIEVMQRNYEAIRMKRAEAEYLKPIGWTVERFTTEGATLLRNYDTVESNLSQYELSVELLVAGFDPALSPPGKIFTMSSRSKGIPVRHDIPGFAAIGSGGVGAEFMLYFKSVSYSLPVRAAAYYALEAKYFGEQASGVGLRTDMYVLIFNGHEVKRKKIRETTLENKLFPICEKLAPRHPEEDEEKNVLNSLPELKGLPLIPLKRKRASKKKTGKK